MNATTSAPAPAKRVSKHIADRKELLATAESILFDHATTQEPLTGDEVAFLESLGLSGDKLRDETRRINRVVRLQSDALTGGDRAELRSKADAAALALATEQPEIERQIIELQASLTRLRSKATATAADRDRAERATVALADRDLLPLDLRHDYNQAKAEFNVVKNAPLDAARHRLQRVRLELGLAGDELAQYVVNKAGTIGPEGAPYRVFVVREEGGRTVTNSAAWSTHRAKLTTEAVALEAEIASRQKDAETARAALNKLLRVYCKD